VAGFISEWWPASNRNGGRLQIGIGGRIASEFAREIGQAATLVFALLHTSFTRIHCGNYAIANTQLDEVVALADEKSAAFWKAFGMLVQGWLFALTGKASDTVRRITAETAALQSTGARLWMPLHISYLTRASRNSANSMTLGAAFAKR
jgi:hypothetical protein